MLTLSGLTVGSYTLEPQFNPSIDTYSVHIGAEDETLHITVTRTNDETIWGRKRNERSRYVAQYFFYSGDTLLDSQDFIAVSNNNPNPFTHILSFKTDARLATTFAVCKFWVNYQGITKEYTVNVYRDL